MDTLSFRLYLPYCSFGLAVLSVAIATLLYFVPPQIQGATVPSQTPSQAGDWEKSP